MGVHIEASLQLRFSDLCITVNKTVKFFVNTTNQLNRLFDKFNRSLKTHEIVMFPVSII